MAGALDPDAALLTGIAHRFALALAVLVTDQELTSESDVPFEPFTAAFDANQRRHGGDGSQHGSPPGEGRWRGGAEVLTVTIAQLSGGAPRGLEARRVTIGGHRGR